MVILVSQVNPDCDDVVRLAYLAGLSARRFEFVEILNAQAWASIIGSELPLTVLRRGFANGTLGIRRLRKSPLGVLSEDVLDMVNTTVEFDGFNARLLVPTPNGLIRVPKVLLLTGRYDPITQDSPPRVRRTIEPKPQTAPAPRCEQCGGPYKPAAAHQKHCSSRCRQRAYRTRTQERRTSIEERLDRIELALAEKGILDAVLAD